MYISCPNVLLRDYNDYSKGRILTFSRKYDHLYKEDQQTPDIHREIEVLATTGRTNIESESETESDTSTIIASTTSNNVAPKRDFLMEYRVRNRGRSESRTGGDYPRGRGRGRKGRDNRGSMDRSTPVVMRTRGQQLKE